MKKKLRHITIENKTFNYVVNGNSLRIFNDNKSNEFVKIDFDTEDDLYLGSLIFSGHFKTYKNNEEIILNINTPSFAKEIILYLEIEKHDFTIQKQHVINNGIQILEKLGYEVTGLEKKSQSRHSS